MGQIKEILRLKLECGLSRREIAQALNMAPTTVWDYLRRAGPAQLTAERRGQMDDAALEALLFPPPPVSLKQKRAVPDWPHVHRELGRNRTFCAKSGGFPAKPLFMRVPCHFRQLSAALK